MQKETVEINEKELRHLAAEITTNLILGNIRAKYGSESSKTE